MRRSWLIYAVVYLFFVSTLAYGGEIIRYNENMVGAGHPTLADTLNRALLIQHNDNGVHTIVPYSALTGAPTTFPYDNLTGPRSSFPYDNLTGVPAAFSVADNSVTPAKLQYDEATGDNNTLFYRKDGKWISPSVSFQDQIDLKQGLDADLTVLSYPTNWRVFVSNGSHAVTEVALGVDNTFFKSGGVATLPSFAAITWSDIASKPTTIAGYGITDNLSALTTLAWDNITSRPTINSVTVTGSVLDNVSNYPAALARVASPTFTGTVTAPTVTIGATAGTSGGAIDNTPIGFTTPSTGVFTTIATDCVSITEFSYSQGVTGPIQAQIDLKRASDNVDFTGAGNALFDNEVTALQYNSSGADNTHYINVANTGPPNVGTETRGDCYYDNTSTSWLCWDGNSWEGPSTSTVHWDNVTSKPALVTADNTVSFTNKTFDAAATGNVLKQTKYWVSTLPQYGVGASGVYDNATHQVAFAHNGDKSVNCSAWNTAVPEDIDTSVDLAAKFKFALMGADTAAHNYFISMKSAADSSAEPFLYVAQGNEVAMTFGGDAAGAANDVETVGFTTLTNWKSNVTAGQFWTIFVCRDGDSDASTVGSYTLSLTIRYGSVQ